MPRILDPLMANEGVPDHLRMERAREVDHENAELFPTAHMGPL